jgi:anti-sigma factor RsiW
MQEPEPVTDVEIEAYQDGELDLDRRLAVEAHLARNAEAARRFFEDLRLRSSLRLIAAQAEETPPAMRRTAAMLADRLNERPVRGFRQWFGPRGLSGLAVAAAFVAVVFLPARDVVASPPDYVGDAVDAYRTALLRGRMVSQIEAPNIDVAEIRRSTNISVPRLPAKWVVTDAQIFPTKEGPALQIMVKTPTEGTLSIFAVRTPSDAPAEPEAVRHEGASVAYWREGDMSYAVTGGEAPETLDTIAEDLAVENQTEA